MSFEVISTQEELDRIVSARLNREAVKANEAMDALKLEHSNALEGLKASHATALTEATKASETAVAAAKADANKATLANLRLTTAADKGVPAELLSGSTAEELKASADKLLTFQKTGTAHGLATGLENITQDGDRDAEARGIFGL